MIGPGAGRVVLTGFQRTTCVAASAMSTRKLLTDRRVHVIVAEELCGARRSSYIATADRPSRVEATRRALVHAGIDVTARPPES